MVDNVQKVEWMRYIAVIRRGSSKIYLEELPIRQSVRGQGGGGALSVEELDSIFKVDSDTPLLAPESVLHTDSAKSYKRLGPFRWPGAGALHDAGFEVRYRKHRWVHTVVVHKRKVGQRVNWTLIRTIRHADGSQEECKGGTQTVDGFWAGLRNNTSRRGV